MFHFIRAARCLWHSFVIVILLTQPWHALKAETVTLKSGEKLDGVIVQRESSYITLNHAGHEISYHMSEIEEIKPSPAIVLDTVKIEYTSVCGFSFLSGRKLIKNRTRYLDFKNNLEREEEYTTFSNNSNSKPKRKIKIIGRGKAVVLLPETLQGTYTVLPINYEMGDAHDLKGLRPSKERSFAGERCLAYASDDFNTCIWNGLSIYQEFKFGGIDCEETALRIEKDVDFEPDLFTPPPEYKLMTAGEAIKEAVSVLGKLFQRNRGSD